MEPSHRQVGGGAPQTAAPGPDTSGSSEVTSSMWIPPFPPAPSGTSMNTQQVAELYNLATECRDMGTQLAWEFQCLAGQEAVD